MSRSSDPYPVGAAQTNRLKHVLAAGQDVAAPKRKGPSLDKQKEWFGTVTGAWRQLLSDYGAADVKDSYMLPDAEVDALKKRYEELDDRLLEIERGLYGDTLEHPKIANMGEAKQFVKNQLNDEQKTMLRNARLNMNEGDYFD